MLTPASHRCSTSPVARTNAPVTVSQQMSIQDKFSVAQVLDFDEEKFARFVAIHRDDRGVFVAHNITDYLTTPLSLKQELWARLCAAAPADTTSSRINLEDLNARLQLLSDAASLPTVYESRFDTHPKGQRTLTPPPSFTPPPITLEDKETNSYHELIRLGGRPTCCLAEFQKAYVAPQQHAKVLIPWLDVLDTQNLYSEDIKPFTTQLERWIHFQEWQLETRGMPCTMQGSNSNEFQHFLEEQRRKFRAMGQAKIADGPNFEASRRKQWQHRQHVSQVKSRTGPRGQAMNTYKGTRESMEVTKRRLKAAGFDSRRPFRFQNNPTEQDERTTWIEYLRFECWWQDMYGTGTVQLRKADERGEPDRETGHSSITGLGDLKTELLGPRTTEMTNTRVATCTSFAAARQSRDEGNDPGTMPSAQPSQRSEQQHKLQQHELQQRRLQWVIAQLASIDANSEASLSSKTIAKRKHGDVEVENEEEDAAQADGSLRKKRNIRGRKTRQARSSKSKEANVDRKSCRKAALKGQKRPRMMLDLICPVQETRTTSNDGHRRSVRLQRGF